MKQKYIVAGIGTEIGKTVVSAILTKKLHAHYWKPVQAGELDNSDSHKVAKYAAHNGLKIHPETYRLQTPMSPHAAADIDHIEISLNQFQLPETKENLIVELAGGLMVPLNKNHTNLDLIKHLKLPVILVANFYLGSINHTLLSIDILKNNGLPLHGIIFNGEVTPSSKEIILSQSGASEIGCIPKIVGEITSEKIEEYGKYLSL